MAAPPGGQAARGASSGGVAEFLELALVDGLLEGLFAGDLLRVEELLDQALLAAITARSIDPDDAYSYATDKRPFQKFVTDTSMLPKVEATGPPPAPAAAAANSAG